MWAVGRVRRQGFDESAEVRRHFRLFLDHFVMPTKSSMTSYAVYLGLAESARDIAIELAKRKQSGQLSIQLAGRMDTEPTVARLAHQSMLATARLNTPSANSVNQVMIGRQLVERHAIATIDYALQLAGGSGFYRANGLERRFRDVQAARYHPLQSGPQAEYAGAMALGLPVDHIF